MGGNGIKPLNLVLENRIKDINNTIKKYEHEIDKLQQENAIVEAALIRYKNVVVSMLEPYREEETCY